MAANARKNIMLGTAGHVDHGKTAWFRGSNRQRHNS